MSEWNLQSSLRLFPAILLLAAPWFAGAGSTQKLPITIPIQVADNLVYMQGRINGSQPLSVVLDTGSSVSIVSPAVAQEIDLRSSGSTQAAGIGHGGNQSLQFVENARLQLGSGDSLLDLDGQRIAILPIGYVADQVGVPTQAFFGSNVFANFCVTVDYERQLATFARSCSPSVAGESIPIKIISGTPFVTAELAAPDGSRTSGLFLLDSGTTGALVLSKKFLAAHPQITAGRRLISAPSVTAVGGKIEMKMVRLAGLDVGKFHFNQIVAKVPESSAGVLANPEIAGFIGAEVLSRFTVTWDYAGVRMVLSPNSHLHNLIEEDCSGLRLTVSPPDYTSIRVEAVLPGSPGAEAGLRVGDVITALDGKRDMPLWRVADDLKKPDSSPMLSIRRGHKDFQATLHLRTLL